MQMQANRRVPNPALHALLLLLAVVTAMVMVLVLQAPGWKACQWPEPLKTL